MEVTTISIDTGQGSRQMNNLSFIVLNSCLYWTTVNSSNRLNLLWPNETIWWHASWFSLVQIMAWHLLDPSHCLNQWLVDNWTRQCFWNMGARSPNATHVSTGWLKVLSWMVRLAINEIFRVLQKIVGNESGLMVLIIMSCFAIVWAMFVTRHEKP